MNKYKSLILIGLFAVGLSSCNTDDLEKDLDALKERVENFEMQVQRLNDEMNIIRVLLDGNKTITNYTIDGNVYTLTLSNGETITLTDGQDGKSYPKITIGENGNWFVNGEDTGNRAKANDGSDVAVTPKFKIENGNWWVSYDGGNNFNDLGVKATGDGATSESPITDFKAENGKFTFTIGGKDYVIPVVEGLICQIVDKKESYNVAQSQTLELKVKVNLKEGDIVRPVVPVEWKASVSNYSSLSGEQELTVKVTAPATASKCVLSVEVTRGVNTATDEVALRTATTSYYDDYMAGLDIQIGNVVINKFTHGDASVLSNGASINNGEGVYFVEENAEISWNGSSKKPIYIVGVSDKVSSTLNLNNGGNTISLASGLVCKNIKISYPSINSGKYCFGLAKEAVVQNLIFDNCLIFIPKDKMFTYLSNGTSSIHNICVNSCKISMPSLSTTTNVVNFLNLSSGSFQSVYINNNVFYCSDENRSVLSMIIGTGNNVSLTDLSFENNTLINILGNHGGTTSGLLKVKNLEKNKHHIVKNNLYWYNVDCIGKPNGGVENTSHLMSEANFFTQERMGNNVVYSLNPDTKIKWQYFRTVPDDVELGFKNEIILDKVNPFTDGTVPHTGTFTYTDEFKSKGIGANIQ